MTIALADYEWLTSAAAAPYLARCAEHTGELTRLVMALRKDLSAERAHLVIEQADLRQRAKEKFRRADEMFFTRKGLEQATDEVIARYKAERLRTPGVILDICCGIGGDLLALGRLRDEHESISVYGLDADPIVAYLAQQNCSRSGDCTVRVLTNLAEDVIAHEVDACHVDPDRRPAGRRTTTMENFTPSLDTLNEWAFGNITGGVKVAPATEVSHDWQQHAEREWIGSRGECRQQMIWFPGIGGEVGRRAATIVDEGAPVRRIVENHQAEPALQTAPLRYVFEAHAAVLAAKVSASLAAELQMSTLTSDGGYLTSDSPARDLAVASFEVLDVLPYDVKQLKAYFRDRHVGRLEIKKRGLDADPEVVRKRLDLRGDEASTLMLARVGARAIAMVVRRLF